MDGKILFNKQDIERMITRIAYQLVEDLKSDDAIILIGVKTGGLAPALKLKKELESIMKQEISFGELDISLYKDDFTEHMFRPVIHSTQIPCSIKGKIVIVVDDIVYSGRTGFSAVEAIMDIGRPKAIKLVSLIETGVREIPVRPDYRGKFIDSLDGYRIKVDYCETGEGKVFYTKVKTNG
ncbi:bifunctional pyr operon transcriptional regulator/uracil phosphoribosyltransferase PyrR [bacterium]|nr:bifunctional pyr operon transcriptional regulator/uracil phosphoribosyltransferase PyrR [bacterium]